ncbi:MAG TPA: transketolase C-terminal domain-containing protein [Candidatus Acidoferrales bacterium]|jgi:transketolase|nr:transketolase C-terminal domain-containing protein [Candidatus Acidoferrales bacterium]
MPTKTRFELKPGPATREAFGRTLVELGRENKDVVVVDADLSKSTMTVYFAKEFPDRFFSCGIAESNMVGVGAGLAMVGKIPFVSTFSVFAMNKGFEQMRIGAAYGRSNLKVVGTHSGISIGEDGPSQMSMEEIGLACSLAGFVVMAPADEASTKGLVRAAAAYHGPVFIRTGRPKTLAIYAADQKFEIGKSIEVMEGRDVTIVANGLLVAQAVLAAEALDAEGISARVIDMHTVKPLDRDAIGHAAAETRAIVVAEEHFRDGGLGVRVAQVVAETYPCAMEFVGLNDSYAESGQPEELLDKYGLMARDVAAAARKVLARKR